VVRFEAQQVGWPQVLQAVGQAASETPAAAADEHVEQLLLHRQVALDFNNEGRAGEEVGQQQPKQAVPVAQRLPRAGHRTALPGSRPIGSGAIFLPTVCLPMGCVERHHFSHGPLRRGVNGLAVFGDLNALSHDLHSGSLIPYYP
jgi:hypothetical protein